MNLRKGTVGATLSRAHKKFRRALGRTAEEKRHAAPRACALARKEDSYSS